MIRIHYGTGKSISSPGGTHSVILGLSNAQKKFGKTVIVVDQIKLFGHKFRTSSPIPKNLHTDFSNEFHFCLSFLHVMVRNPRLILKSKINVFHFHGPWYLESKIQNPKARIRNLLKLLLEISVFRQFPLIICVSQAFADILVNFYHVKPSKIRVIPAGIDEERFSLGANRREFGDHHTEIHIGTVRRLVPRMGLEVLIESMRELDNCKLRIAGIGYLERDLAELVEKLGLRKRVEFVGYIEEADLPNFYRSLDLCVIPSIALEGFCITALEAMACGTPVIASKLGGLIESVGQCDPNLLFTPNSISAIVSKIQFAKSNYLGNYGKFRNYALQYNWKLIAEKVEVSITNEIISKNKF